MPNQHQDAIRVFKGQRMDGSKVKLEITLSPITISQGEYMMATIADINESELHFTL